MVSDGAILLGFIAIVITVLVLRFRRRLGMPASMKTIATSIALVVIVLLALYAASRR